jgi:hypothetical protein
MSAQFNDPFATTLGTGRIYSTELLILAQSLLAEIADLECAFERDMEAARSSLCSEVSKIQRIKELERRHRERHAPLARELADLEKAIAHELRL